MSQSSYYLAYLRYYNIIQEGLNDIGHCKFTNRPPSVVSVETHNGDG